MPNTNCLFRRSSGLMLLFSLLITGAMSSCHSGKASEKPSQTGPRVLDDRLILTLFAEDPAIVTPIGIAVDSLDRVFVLESHTHLPPKDYPGPDGDKIKVFVDSDGDGHPEKTSVFAEGFKEGVNITFSPDGHLYVVTSRAVYAVYDRDGDGVSEERVNVVQLTEPEHVYAHAALLGITFSPDGWMYISRGNTGSAPWKMVGAGQSSLSGYGDGGNIVRVRPDGTKLEEVATGFWNPIDLKFDDKGRLLTVDNDPDSRGPNRLIHVVPGGDYGYKSIYGGSGIHPYLAWNGELPGTLPYAVGLGEAPSGLFDAGLAALPKDYQGQMLATIWEESRIVRVKLTPKGVSLTGTTEVVVEGDQEFRPVALATDSRGTVYITDWVLRDYPNHGRGRIWKLVTRPDVAALKPRQPFASPLPNKEGEQLHKIYAAKSPADAARLLEALKSKDPFLRHAAVHVLAHPAFQRQVMEAIRNADPDVRLGAMIALHRSGYQDAEPIVKRLLTDPDVRVRQRALLWAGQEGMTALRPYLDRALAVSPVSPALFETYLETVRHLSPSFIQAYRDRSEPYAKSINRQLPEQFIQTFIRDDAKPAALRAMAIRQLEEPEEEAHLLVSLLTDGQDPQLRLEAVRALAEAPNEESAERLLQLAVAPSNPMLLRAEALLSLARQAEDRSAEVVPLLQDAEQDIQIEAARYLRTKLSPEGARQAFLRWQTTSKENSQDPLQQQFALAMLSADEAVSFSRRPSSLTEWESELTSGGDPQRGHRVFFSLQSACSSCHAVQGRGGDLGPDLTNVGLSKSRNQLIASILRPSEEVTPEYQGWFIRLKNGQMHQGRQVDVGGTSIKLYTHTAGFVSFPKKEILDYGMIKSSLMPDGLETHLTVSDLRDLVSFLEAEK